MAIISKLKEKTRSISSRAVVISLTLVLLMALIINIVPAHVLSRQMEKRSESEIIARGEHIASGEEFTADKNERILFINAKGKVTFDSKNGADSLVGKYLLITPVRAALSGNVETKTRFEEGGLVTYTAIPKGTGAVYVWRNDPEAPAVVSGVKYSLILITLILCVIFLTTLLFGAWRLKERIKNLTAVVRKREKASPIEVLGEDEVDELASELNKLSKQIIETEELRRTFVSDASHELRTPLSSIQLLVDSIIQTENIDIETTREFMTDISEQIERLTRIAERLLILTRLDGVKDLLLESVDMKKVAESVIATLEQSALEAHVELKCSFSEGVIFRGSTDGAYQIIFNLVENAIKYNRPGGCVRVYIFKNDKKCHLIVDDNGIGIPQEDFELIFERFYRVDKARARNDKSGTGLGLAIVAKNVANYDGEIKVEPSVDGGTRFTVTFDEEVAE